MSVEMIWVVALVAVAVAAVVGYFVGRSGHAGAQDRIAELETEVKRGKEEFVEYKKDVETHFDKSASLFVDMAGSYKALFEHLSSDYEKLSEGSARELFKERVAALLMDGEPPKTLGHAAAEAAQADTADASQEKSVGETTPSDETVAAQVVTGLASEQAEAPKVEAGQTPAAATVEVTVDAPKTAEVTTAEATSSEGDVKPAEAAASTPADDTAAVKEQEAQSPDTTQPDAETTLEKASRRRAEAEAAGKDKA